jgi:hypothetical protein
MGLIISQLNSIRFKKQDSEPPNFDNTLLADEKFYNDTIYTYCQRFPDDSTQIVQLKSDSDELPVAIATRSDKTQVALTVTEVSSYDTDSSGTDDTWYFEFTVDFSTFTQITDITVTQDTDTFKSEPFIGDPDVSIQVKDSEVLKLEYFNFDNAFNIDFSTGITFELYVEAVAKNYKPQGEKSIYDNQREVTILKSTKQRTLELQTLEIPRYLSETIDLITGLDNLVINSIAYVYEKDTLEVDPFGDTNFVTASAVLINKEYLGTNSSDIGFNCDVAPTDSQMSVLTILNASGGETFTIPAGWQVHTLRSQWVSGATVEVKLGTSVGGEQLVSARDIDSVDTDRTISIHSDIDRDAIQDIYATVTGGVANLDLQLLQNTES